MDAIDEGKIYCLIQFSIDQLQASNDTVSEIIDFPGIWEAYILFMNCTSIELQTKNKNRIADLNILTNKSPFFYLNCKIGFNLFIYLFLYLFIHFAAVWRDFDSLSNPD